MKPQFSPGERGQVLMIAALLLPVLLAMVGMAIDVGTYSSERRSLQNAADGAALAAGQELPDADAAEAKAYEYTSEHGIDPSDVTVSVTGGSTNPNVRVTIETEHDFAFMAIVGIGSADVGAVAAAGKFSPGAGEGVVPWGIEQATIDAAGSGQEVIIKYDSTGPYPGQGNFGAIRIDGNGGSDYEDSVMYGSDFHVCSVYMDACDDDACPVDYPTSCAEDSPECDGPNCPPKTGNMTGNTEDAVDHRLDYTSEECDTFEEAFDAVGAFRRYFDDQQRHASDEMTGSTGGRLSAPPPHHGGGSHPTFTPTATATRTRTPTPTSTPGPTDTPAPTDTAAPTNTPAPTSTPNGSDQEYKINPNCNPWSGGRCETPTSICSRRIFLIPIIDEFGDGSSDDLEIQGFALVFLEGYGDSCTGSSCDVRVRFVKADVTTGAFAGDYDPDSLNHFVRLTE
jgi:hypothetical protein